MQPRNPNPNFDFMLKDAPAAKRGSAMPTLPKPLVIGIGVFLVIIVLIVISSLMSGRKNGSLQPYINVLAREQEILRVTDLAQQQLQLQDPQTQALAATVNSSLSSDQSQLSALLAQNKIKPTPLQLAADTDKTVDAALQSATQNNTLDDAYISYLRGALSKYEAELQTAYKSAGPSGKAILKQAFESTGTLLSAPPLKS